MGELTIEQRRALALARARMRVSEGKTSQQGAPREDRNYIADLGRAATRGLGQLIETGVPKVIEDAPEIVASQVAPFLRATSPVFGALAAPFIQPAARAVTPEFREAVAPVTTQLKETGETIRKSVKPRQRGDVYEEYERGGIGAALASLGETAAESSAPTLAALGTAAITRNPAAAATVMGVGSVPQTYAGIRETQQQEGIDDVGRAVAGTAVSSAFDILTGVGGAIRSLGREATEEILRRGVMAAAKRVAETGVKEGGTEILQNLIEQVAGGADPTTKEALLSTLEAGMVGVVSGTGFGTATEGVRALQKGEETPQVEPTPTPEAAPEAAPDAETERRISAYLNVGYPRRYAEEMVAADILRETEEKRREAEKAAEKEAAPAPGETAPIEEPRRALKPLTNKEVKAAADWLRADVMSFPEDLVRQPTKEEIDQAARELAQDPYVGPLDMLNAVMERNDARGAAPAPTPATEPITPASYVDRYLAGEGRGTTPADLELQQYAANNPAEIEAEFVKRQQVADDAEAAPNAPEPVAEPEAVVPEIPAAPERPYDIVWKEAKQKYPGVMNPQAIDFMQGFGAVSPDSPEGTPLQVQQMAAMNPEDLTTYVEGMQRGFDLHGIPVKVIKAGYL